MKKHLGIFGLLLFFLTSAQASTKLTLNALTKTVSERNYAVLEEAEKSYQAKLTVEQARNNLLPKLNIWTLAKVVMDPAALLDAVPDIAPFLVPSNWFRLKETELLYSVEKEGYRALWANEVAATRTLYFRILVDLNLQSIVSRHRQDARDVYNIAKSRLLVGLEDIETVRALEIIALKLEQDDAQLGLLIEEELLALSFSLGLPAEETIELEPIEIPDPSSENRLDYKLYVLKVLDTAPEVRQYDRLLKVIPLLKKEAKFSFLGNSEISRGAAGGVFDGIAIPNGLGFSTATTIKLIDTQKRILELQRQGVIETVKRQLKNVVNTHNTTVTFYGNAERQAYLAEANIRTLKQKVLMGERVDLRVLSDAFETRTLTQATKLDHLFRFRMNKDRLARLLLENEFSKLPKVP